MAFRDDFDRPDLDTEVWLPHYLPAWSSRAQTRASYRLEDSCLVLDVPVDHPVWPIHQPPLRVSAVQSGSWSGPVDSVFGQQRFEEGQLVREEQPRFEGWLPATGHVEIRCRMTLSPRSMGAVARPIGRPYSMTSSPSATSRSASLCPSGTWWRSSTSSTWSPSR